MKCSEIGGTGCYYAKQNKSQAEYTYRLSLIFGAKQTSHYYGQYYAIIGLGYWNTGIKSQVWGKGVRERTN